MQLLLLIPMARHELHFYRSPQTVRKNVCENCEYKGKSAPVARCTGVGEDDTVIFNNGEGGEKNLRLLYGREGDAERAEEVTIHRDLPCSPYMSFTRRLPSSNNFYGIG